MLILKDWGDFGHMQPLPVSFLGFFVGAGLSWTSTTIVDKEKLCRLLNLFVFRDRQDKMGKIMYDLGNVYLSTGSYTTSLLTLQRRNTCQRHNVWKTV